MEKIKIILVLLMSLLISLGSDTQATAQTKPRDITLPRKEMRAVWMATVGHMDWPSKGATAEQQKQEYIDYLETFERYNINTVIVQIRPMADAFYPSALEPWSQYISGTQGADPGYDVLQFMLDETHRRGMEFHAWLNPYRISNNVKTFDPAPNHIYNIHPEWTMTYNDRLLIFRPALPEVRSFLLEVVRDLITKYDVDGVHFDDYFYPYPSKGVEIDDRADFEKYGSGYASIEDFRRGNVDKAIEGVHNLIKEVRPDVLFSISPYAVWRNKADDVNGSETSGLNNYDGLYADIRLWCEKGWMDYVVPQLYASTENIAANFKVLTDWWPKNSFDVPVLIGYGLYKFGVPAEGDIFQKPKELEAQFSYAGRQEKIVGSVLFSTEAFRANRIDILSTIDKVYADPALVPFMGRKTLADPTPVSKLSVKDNLLTWTVKGDNLRYVVYKIENGNAKIATVTTQKTYKPQADGDYVVSTLNKDNTESELSKIVTYKSKK